MDPAPRPTGSAQIRRLSRLSRPRTPYDLDMSTRPSIIERAFQIASSGSCAVVQDVRDQLAREDYPTVDGFIRGTSLLRQLQYLITSSRTAPPAS